MKITKIGHCCLVIEEAGIKILTDPGAWTTIQNSEKDINLVLITHEHPDHLHVDSVKEVLRNNPKAQIITNSAVGKILESEGIQFAKIEHGESTNLDGILIEGFGSKHAQIYQDYGQVLNTGYFVAGRLFYPGDALYDPQRTVEVLALPVSGPWMKASDAITYALKINPQVCFPVHDGYLKIKAFLYNLFGKFLGDKFKPLEDGETFEA